VTKRVLMVDYADDALGCDKNPSRSQYALIAQTCGVLCLESPVASGKYRIPYGKFDLTVDFNNLDSSGLFETLGAASSIVCLRDSLGGISTSSSDGDLAWNPTLPRERVNI
jgi:hypothetical protein